MTINSPTITKNIMDNIKYPTSCRADRPCADVWCFATDTGRALPQCRARVWRQAAQAFEFLFNF